jgi:hypothetical protein
MRRTQLYFDPEDWAILQLRSRESGLTVSELVRQAVRERYASPTVRRKQAMLAFVGSRKNRSDLGSTEAYIRKLRRGSRLERLSG